MVSNGQLTAGHARTLITVDDPMSLAKEIVERGLSVREAEALTQRGAMPKRAAAEPEPKDTDTLAIEKQLSDFLGLKVTIEHKANGGKVEIRYKTLEQLDGVLSKLTG